MKTTKVRSVQGNKSFESEWGALQPDGKKLMFCYDYEFEDGTFLQANHKTVPSPFKIGDTVEYEVTRESEQYGKSGRVCKPQEQFNSTSIVQKDDGLQGIKIGHAITNAVHIVCMELGNGYEQDLKKGIIKYAKIILKIGEELNNEVSKKSQPIQPPAEVYEEQLPPLESLDNNDIPF